MRSDITITRKRSSEGPGPHCISGARFNTIKRFARLLHPDAVQVARGRKP